MNLERMITAQISSIVPRSTIDVIIYKQQTVDDNGLVVTEFYNPVATTAQVQSANLQKLEHLLNINYTKIYKDFRLQSYSLTGLERNLGSGGDYIRMNNLYYKIVLCPEDFKTGWLWVVGCETSEFNGVFV